MKTLTELLTELSTHPELIKLVNLAHKSEIEDDEPNEILMEFVTLLCYTQDCNENLKTLENEKI